MAKNILQTFAEHSWLSDRFAALRGSWNSWIEKASFMTNIHLLELYLDTSHTQIDSFPSVLSMAGFTEASNTPLELSAIRPSGVVQDISDAVDAIMEDPDADICHIDTSDSEEQQIALCPDHNAYFYSERLEPAPESTLLQLAAAPAPSLSETFEYDFGSSSYQSYGDTAAIEQAMVVSESVMDVSGFDVWDVSSLQDEQPWSW